MKKKQVYFLAFAAGAFFLMKYHRKSEPAKSLSDGIKAAEPKAKTLPKPSLKKIESDGWYNLWGGI